MSPGVVFVALAFGVGLIIVIVVVVIWWVAGGTLPSTGSNGSNPSSSNCDECKKVDSWWQGLSTGQKILQGAQYAAKKLDCAIRGCPTH